MSWQLLRSCAILSWLMAGCMFAAGVISGVHDISYFMPVFLAAVSSIVGYLFWRRANEQFAARRAVLNALRSDLGLPDDVIDGLAKGELTPEQYQALVEWSDEVDR